MLDVDLAVVADVLDLVVLDVDRLVALVRGLEADLQGIVVLHHAQEITLGVEVDFLLALLVLEAQFVEAVAALGRLRLDGRDGLFLRQRIRRHRVRVVDAAGDQRAIRVALQETHDDFHADARHRHRAPSLARPAVRHAHPARTVFIVLAQPVPVELHLDAAILVGPDFLAGLADDHGGLRSLHDRPGDHGQGPIGMLLADRADAADTGQAAAVAAARIVVARDLVTGRDDQVIAVLIVARMVGQREQAARIQAARIGRGGDLLALPVQRFHARPRQ